MPNDCFQATPRPRPRRLRSWLRSWGVCSGFPEQPRTHLRADGRTISPFESNANLRHVYAIVSCFPAASAALVLKKYPLTLVCTSRTSHTGIWLISGLIVACMSLGSAWTGHQRPTAFNKLSLRQHSRVASVFISNHSHSPDGKHLCHDNQPCPTQ
jgi:hypothetical protein